MRLGVKLVREQLHKEAGKGQGSGKVKVKKLFIWRKAGHGILSWRVNGLVPGQRWVIFWTVQNSWVASVVFPVVVCGAVWLHAGKLHAEIPAPRSVMDWAQASCGEQSALGLCYHHITWPFSSLLVWETKVARVCGETVPYFCREVQGKMIIIQ